MFIVGFFKLAYLGIEVGKPLKGTVGCQAFSRNPKGGLGRSVFFCPVKSFMREPSLGAHCRPVRYLRGLVTGGGKGSAATAYA